MAVPRLLILFATIAACAIPLPVLTRETLLASPPDPEERTMVLENFESGSDWRLNYRPVEGVSGYLSVEELEPTMEAGETRYLSVLLHSDGVTAFRIEPSKPVPIQMYLRSIVVTVYGFGEGGTLYVDLLDQYGRLQRVALGRVDFTGWRRLGASIAGRLDQMPPSIRTPGKGLLFRGLYYEPGGTGKDPVRRFYIDSIHVAVRPHFRLPAIQWE